MPRGNEKSILTTQDNVINIYKSRKILTFYIFHEDPYIHSPILFNDSPNS